MFQEPLGQGVDLGKTIWTLLENSGYSLQVPSSEIAGGLQRGLPSQSRNDSTWSLLPLGSPGALSTANNSPGT